MRVAATLTILTVVATGGFHWADHQFALAWKRIMIKNSFPLKAFIFELCLLGLSQPVLAGGWGPVLS